MAKKYWIMKSEPSEFGIDDLVKKGSAFWDGVRNYQVRNMFRDDMQVGDLALFYHSNAKEIGIVGEMKILETGKPDPTQFIPGHKYYDPKSTTDAPRWLGPVVGFVRKFSRVITLTEIKANPMFSDLPLVRKGSRLSVIPITKEEYTALVALGRN